MSSKEESVWIPSYEKRDKHGIVESEETPMSFSENIVLGTRLILFSGLQRPLFKNQG